MRTRLGEIEGHLANIIPYAISFLEGLITKYRDRFPRRTEIVSFERTDVREAAQRDLKLHYDRQTGYLGYEVSTGAALFDVSTYDRVLVIRKDASYAVVDAPDKLFVGKGMLHCSMVDREQVFNVVYEDPQNHTYLKRCCIDKFVLGRDYSLIPDNAKVLRLTTDSETTIVLEYKPKPRLRVLEETFQIAQYPVRGLRASGIRLSSKQVQSSQIRRPEEP